MTAEMLARCRAALDLRGAALRHSPDLGLIAALRTVLDGIEATLAEHTARCDEGIGWRADDSYGSISPSCASCGTPDEYAVPWPCVAYHRATTSLTAIASALGVQEADRG